MMLAPCDDTSSDPLTRRERLLSVAAVLPQTDGASPALQQFVDDVAAVLDAPCAGVSLILNDAGVLAASHGVGGWLAEAGGMPAEWAPCASVVRHDAPLLVTDTHDDPAHSTNPLVTITGVRSYAGVPLHLRGQAIGALCVLDGQPGAFTDADLHKLNDLAARAVQLLQDAVAP